MQDVTPNVLQYREAARLLWNGFFREQDAYGGGAIATDEALDDWIELKRRLFVALVLRHTGDDQHASVLLDPKLYTYWNKPIGFLRVVPSSPEVPARISRTPGRSGYWDHPVDRLAPDDDLRFIDFFDFGQAGYLDFQYFHVAIVGAPRHPELAGHEALVAVRYASVFVDDAAVQHQGA